jgi:hypothetical protein
VRIPVFLDAGDIACCLAVPSVGWEDVAALAGPLPAGHDRRPTGVIAVVDVTR